jgi:hypothetical protein
MHVFTERVVPGMPLTFSGGMYDFCTTKESTIDKQSTLNHQRYVP